MIDGSVVSYILTSPRFHPNTMSIRMWHVVLCTSLDSDVNFSFVCENALLQAGGGGLYTMEYELTTILIILKDLNFFGDQF